jgi:tRNA G10  N-methylase Trm11
MYFVVLWKHHSISLAELESIVSLEHKKIYWDIVIFDTSIADYNTLKHLWGIIKYGTLFDFFKLSELITHKCIGISDESLWLQLKKQHKCKRYKYVPIHHTDLEIVDHGIELIPIPYNTNLIGIVEWYQNIWLYTSIDINKPTNGMQIGMMPAKLTHILINLAFWSFDSTSTKDCLTVFDPFCGFGTTMMMANALWYNTIWSDINITQTKANLKRRKEQSYYQDLHMTCFKHDVNAFFDQPVLRQVDMVVSEWWLWPVITHNTTISQYQLYSKKVVELYKTFWNHIANYRIRSIVMTIPHYIYGPENTIADDIWSYVTTLGYEVQRISQLYHRPKQLLARKIGIFRIWNIEV